MYVGVFVTFSKLIKLFNIVRFRKKKSHYENILITLVKVLKKILNLFFCGGNASEVTLGAHAARG